MPKNIRNTNVERWDPKSDLTLLERISSCSFLCQTDLTLIKKNICIYNMCLTDKSDKKFIYSF